MYRKLLAHDLQKHTVTKIYIYSNTFLIYFYERVKIFALVQLVFLLMSEFDNSKLGEQRNDEEDNVEDQ